MDSDKAIVWRSRGLHLHDIGSFLSAEIVLLEKGAQLSETCLRFSIWDSRINTIHDVLPVIREHYRPVPISAEWASYKFCPDGQPTIAAVAWDDGAPVGIIGASIREFSSHYLRVAGSLSLIVFVDPHYRGLRVAARLLALLGDALSTEGVAFFVSLPNRGYEQVLEKAGHTRIAVHTTSIYPNSAQGVLRAALSRSDFKYFNPLDSSSPSIDALERFSLLASRRLQRNVMSSLSVQDLSHQLSLMRNYRYEIDFLEGLGVITSHGMRGRVYEIRVIATAPRVVFSAERKEILHYLARKYRPDILTLRESAPSPPRFALSGSGIVLRAEPPVYLLSTSSKGTPSEFGGPQLSGIDAHTW